MLITKNYFLNILLIIIFFFITINNYILINILNCCASYLLSVWPDFAFWKYEIKGFIIKLANKKYCLVIYYSEYYCKLNYINHF